MSAAHAETIRRSRPLRRAVEPGRGERRVAVPAGGTWIGRLLAFIGPGYMVSVGYMDPGNWATDLAGGAQFGYTLLWVILLSNLMAILLQALAARLGIATGRDLAQACRAHYPRAGRPRALARLRAGDHRLRPGRGDRHGHRAAAAVRHPADRRRADRRARRVPGAVPDEPRLPLPRGVRRRAAGGHRGLLRRRRSSLPQPPVARGAAAASCRPARDRHQSRRCSTSRSASSAPR